MKYIFKAERQNKLAQQLHDLHHAGKTLILPNVWDAFSAKIFENAKFPALATTSSGISWVYGAQDGEHIDPELMVQAVSIIAQAVQIPVTADVEGCYYHKDLKDLYNFTEKLIKGGVVGLNIEDTHNVPAGLNPIEEQVAKIKTIRQAGEDVGVSIFINARTDAMTLDMDLTEKTSICIERAQAFKEAGANGIFIPFVSDLDTVKILKENIDLPLNILYEKQLPIPKLQNIGVERISVGGKPILAAMQGLQEIAQEMAGATDWPTLNDTHLGYREVNGWFAK